MSSTGADAASVIAAGFPTARRNTDKPGLRNMTEHAHGKRTFGDKIPLAAGADCRAVMVAAVKLQL
jgi:hypothetical protein